MKKYIKLFLIIIASIIFTSNVNALVGNTYSDIDRDTLPNHGVNKKWIINNNNIDNVNKTPAVDASLKIYDYSNVLTQTEKNSLYERIIDFNKKYKTDLVIVTVEIPYTGKNNEYYTEEFAADFYDYNDFGINYDNYSGIVLVRNTYSLDPYYDMYTFGDAQLYFDQNRYDDVLDSIYNDLHTGSYYGGFNRFIELVKKYYNKGYAPEYSYAYIDEDGSIKYNFVPPYPIAAILAFVITAIIIRIYVLKNRMVNKATEARTYFSRARSNIPVKVDKFITSHTTSYTVSSSSGGYGGGGGGHSSFGSSGGGHSSGGGRHG